MYSLSCETHKQANVAVGEKLPPACTWVASQQRFPSHLVQSSSFAATRVVALISLIRRELSLEVKYDLKSATEGAWKSAGLYALTDPSKTPHQKHYITTSDLY